MVGGVDVQVNGSPVGGGAGSSSNQAVGVLVELPHLDRSEGEGFDGLPLGFISRLGSGGIDPVPAVGEEVSKALAEGVARERVAVKAVGLLEGDGVSPATAVRLLGLRGGLALIHRAASWKLPMSVIPAEVKLKRLAGCQGCG